MKNVQSIKCYTVTQFHHLLPQLSKKSLFFTSFFTLRSKWEIGETRKHTDIFCINMKKCFYMMAIFAGILSFDIILCETLVLHRANFLRLSMTNQTEKPTVGV